MSRAGANDILNRLTRAAEALEAAEEAQAQQAALALSARQGGGWAQLAHRQPDQSAAGEASLARAIVAAGQQLSVQRQPGQPGTALQPWQPWQQQAALVAQGAGGPPAPPRRPRVEVIPNDPGRALVPVGGPPAFPGAPGGPGGGPGGMNGLPVTQMLVLAQQVAVVNQGGGPPGAQPPRPRQAQPAGHPQQGLAGAIHGAAGVAGGNLGALGAFHPLAGAIGSAVQQTVQRIGAAVDRAVQAASPNHAATLSLSVELLRAKIGFFLLPAVDVLAKRFQDLGDWVDRVQRAAPELRRTGADLTSGATSVGGVVSGQMTTIANAGLLGTARRVGGWLGMDQENLDARQSRLAQSWFGRLTGIDDPKRSPDRALAGLPQPTIGTAEQFHDRLQTAGLIAGTLEGKMAEQQLKALEDMKELIKVVADNSAALKDMKPAFRG